MKEFISALEAAHIGAVLPNEPMSDYTTWKVGGPADVLVVPKGKQELVYTIKLLHDSAIPWITIGRGSNMLVGDNGFRGAVVKLGEGMDTVRFDDTLVIAGGAYSFIKLCVQIGKQGLTGLEFAGGIPGTVGGAVYMNAGAHGSDVSRVLKSAEVVLETGELVTFDAPALEFAYRTSILQRMPGIVTEAIFELAHGDRKEIAAAMATFKERRQKTQPLPMNCAGSTFRNPEGHFAAKLIEEAGLKGHRIGGAEVSTLHANFIMNTGNATARDVLALMKHIQAIVLDKFGVELVPEVLVVGER